MKANNDWVTGLISKEEYLIYKHPAVQIAKLKSNEMVTIHIHTYVFGDVIVILSEYFK